MVKIEISYTTEPDEFPEHYGYYDDIDSAKDALETIREDLEREGEL